MNRGPLKGKNGECHSKCPQGNMFSRLDAVISWINDKTQINSLLCFPLIRSCWGRLVRWEVLT